MKGSKNQCNDLEVGNNNEKGRQNPDKYIECLKRRFKYECIAVVGDSYWKKVFLEIHQVCWNENDYLNCRLKGNFVIGYRVDVSFRVLMDVILDSERVWVR